MAIKYGAAIDMNGNQIEDFRVENLASDPSAGSAGRVWWNTSSGDLKVDNGSAIRTLVTKTFMESFGLGTATVPLQNDMGATGIATGFYRTLTTPTDAPVASGEAFDFIHVAGFEDAFMQIAASRTTGVIYTRTAIADGTKGAWTALFNGNWSSITGTPTTLSGYGITDAVPNTRTISAGTGLSGGGSLASNRTLSLANTAVSAGSYGSATAVPAITVDAQGRLTAASNTNIAIPASQVTDFATAVNTQVAAYWDSIAGTDADVDTIREVLDLVLANADDVTNLIGRYNADFGDGSTTTYAITHSLNSLDVTVEVYEKSSGDTVICDVSRTSVNAISITTSPAPATNAYRVVVKK